MLLPILLRSFIQPGWMRANLHLTKLIESCKNIENNMKFKLLLFTLIIFTVQLFPQIVVTVPAEPTENDSITVYFDATQPGAEELRNYTGTVYAHTGVNTNLGDWQHVIGNWGVNSTQPALTRDSANHYHLTIGYPRTFYSISDPSEHITALCFVFRSSDANLQTDPDIFIDVYEPGLNLVVNYPDVDLRFGDPMRSPVFSGPTDTTNISISCIEIGTVTSSITLYFDGIFAAQSSTNDIFSQFFASQYSAGAHTVTAVAADTSGLSDTLSFFIMINPVVQNLPCTGRQCTLESIIPAVQALHLRSMHLIRILFM